MRVIARRQCLRLAAALAAGVVTERQHASGRPPAVRGGCTLSIGTYSAKGMALEDAIALVAAIGYDGIEIAAQSGFAGAPEALPGRRREAVRRQIDAAGLKLTALMEQLTPSRDDRGRRAVLERLGGVADLARELAPGHPPLIQTVLGGGSWDEVKGLFRDRVGEWLEVTRGRGVVLAIKPHRGGALSRPDEAVWLITQLGGSPWLRMVYDYSHYAFRNMPLEETLRTALPYTAHVAVKDAVQRGGRIEFALPGASGGFDYARVLRLLHDGGYRGDVCCEVSAMVSSKPGYDPTAAARACYEVMSRAFVRAGVPRA